MTNHEYFKPQEHRRQIEELFYPALAIYLLALARANVPPEDISRISEVVTERSTAGLRKAQAFVEFASHLK